MRNTVDLVKRTALSFEEKTSDTEAFHCVRDIVISFFSEMEGMFDNAMECNVVSDITNQMTNEQLAYMLMTALPNDAELMTHHDKRTWMEIGEVLEPDHIESFRKCAAWVKRCNEFK